MITQSSSVSASSAAQKERSVISLSCTPQGQYSDAVCQALVQELAQALPGHVLRRMDDLSEAPVRAGDLVVAFRLSDTGEDHISGHLEWRHGGQAGFQSGPELRMNVMDATLAQAGLANFASDLLKISPGLITEAK